MEILPAILPKNFREIEEKTALIVGISPVVQVDICDGKYVPSTTWPYWKADIKPDENFAAILKEERGMPQWEDIDYEFDLMIENPTIEDAQKWLSVGATRIVFHHESSPDLNPVIDIVQGLVEIGIALDLKTPSEELKKYADKIQFIQCMGIRKAGFQGQEFDARAIEKVKELRVMFPNLKIQVDGGVSLENAEILKDAGADRLVVGSAIFGGDVSSDNQIEDVVDRYTEFTHI